MSPSPLSLSLRHAKPQERFQKQYASPPLGEHYCILRPWRMQGCSFSALGEAIHALGTPSQKLHVINGILHVPIDIAHLEGLANARPSHPNAQDIIEIDNDLTNNVAASSSSAAISSDLSASLPTGRKAKSHAKAHLRRAFSRSNYQQTHQMMVKQVTAKKFQQAKTIHMDFEPIGQGYQGKRDEYDPVLYSLEMLKALGFDELEWDGYDPLPVVDVQRRVIAYLAGQPCENFIAVRNEIVHLFEWAQQQCTFTERHTNTRRGIFAFLTCGISFGGGQVQPGNLRASPHHQMVIDEMRGNWALTCLVGFVDCTFEVAFPAVRQEYESVLTQTVRRIPSLHRNWTRSLFASAMFNLGPATSTLCHKDYLNSTLGVCAIYCDGNFDYTRGGHLILWDLKLVIQFPPGSTIFIPSALFEHSNTVIQPGETRISFTQYSVAGLFQWVGNGGKTDREINNGDCTIEKVGVHRHKETAWGRGLKLFSKRL
ncbi:uncharacterized protein ARMOST_00558 [Armillaria ostoyae]|uniref:Uncharacterized protein n=1 Tax=Armillaria ostoyae TaxID=47428 RepID=A0A284QLG7_ARMOS|nr:uncharacterized protein ARMOST_00558 [Armillaria ostoyae]